MEVILHPRWGKLSLLLALVVMLPLCFFGVAAALFPDNNEFALIESEQTAHVSNAPDLPASHHSIPNLSVTAVPAPLSNPPPTTFSLPGDSSAFPALVADRSLWKEGEETEEAAVTPTRTYIRPVNPTIVVSDSLQASQIIVSPGFRYEATKIGFHVGPGGNNNGLGNWMHELDSRGIPFFLKAVDTAGPLLEAQRLMQASGVEHTLVYRRSGGHYELPNYRLNPVLAAREHWARHRDAFPPELDPALVWIETINEPDKNRSGWLGMFAIETARLAMNDGFRWAAFGWSAGEPEIYHWELPAMQAFLQMAAQHPDQIAVALHEYSYVNNQIDRLYPNLVGRFQQLFQVSDNLGIDRPTVLITEWGWTYETVPTAPTAMEHIQWADRLYAMFPEVKGAAIWYLGPGFGNIADLAQKLIEPLTNMAQSRYYIMPAGAFSVDHLARPLLSGASSVGVTATAGMSLPETLPRSSRDIWSGSGAGHDPGYCPRLDGAGWTNSLVWPVNGRVVREGRGFGPGHPAIDILTDVGEPIYAAANGVVIWSGYSSFGGGNVIVLAHGGGWRTYYAHLDTVLVVCGQQVNGGDSIGTAGMTGTNWPHLHFEVQRGEFNYDPLTWLPGALFGHGNHDPFNHPDPIDIHEGPGITTE